MANETIGYTAGVFDLFHVGHLQILRRAKAMCDRLIVGVSTDELVKYKNKVAIIPFEERCEIVRNIKHVDVVVPQESLDKFAAWEKVKFNILFVGDDWHASDSWKQYEDRFDSVGVKVVYFPYTKGTSSTLINELILETRKYRENK